MSSVTAHLDPKRFIEAFKNRLGVDRDVDLAEALGVGKSTIASWRKRGIVPDAIVDRARQEFDLTREYIDAFTINNREHVSMFSGIGFYYAILRLGATLPESELLDFASRLYRTDQEIIERIKLSAEVIPEGFASAGLALFSAIERGELASPDQMKAWLARKPAESDGIETVPHSVPHSSS